MKTKIVFTVILSSLFITNCEKKQINYDKGTYSNDGYAVLISLLKEKTSAFKAKEDALSINTKIKINWHLVKEDFKGAATGGAAGATIGGAIGGPGGAIGGAIGGGIVGAFLFTIAAASGVPNDLRTIPPLANPNEGVKNNPLNDYEIVGATHNLLVNEVLKNPDVILVDNHVSAAKVYDFSIPYIVSISRVGPKFTSYFPLSTLENIYNDYLQNPNQDLVAFINELEHAGKITSLESDILHEYSTGINSIKNVSDFQEYSIDIENTIITSNIPEKSKAIVLGFMAVSRYSVAYWNAPR